MHGIAEPMARRKSHRHRQVFPDLDWNMHTTVTYTLNVVTLRFTSAPPAAAKPVPSLPSGIIPVESIFMPASHTQHLPDSLTIVSAHVLQMTCPQTSGSSLSFLLFFFGRSPSNASSLPLP